MDRTDTLVAAQAVALAGLAWPGPPLWRPRAPVRAAGVLLAAAGAALALAGVRPYGRHLTPHVQPAPAVPLITTGAYRVIRHPIYTGLTLGGAGVALLRRRPEPVASWAVLTAVLTTKSLLEERALTKRFGAQYVAYAARTPRLPGRRRRRADG
ncbi:isoprenylcysteine carboxylmethyltransferase family protein [Georgenia sp. SYP-B2076]|uniref:methyltransferase family protein n=1 Tax=Georgenia sp. SYP-B2076 TaxID=2495881 RepID=UPI000F8DCA49|nr:methyltransferase [Georgenia sp. SYP-B2076]